MSNFFAPRKALLLVLGLAFGAQMAAAQNLGGVPECARNCVATAATSVGCSLEDAACLCAHPGVSKAINSCSDTTCADPADKKSIKDTMGAVLAVCAAQTTPSTTNSASSTAATASASKSSSAHSGSSSKSSSASSSSSTAKSSTKTNSSTGTTTTTSASASTTIPTTPSPVPTSTNSFITSVLPTPTLLQALPTDATGTSVVLQTVVVPSATATSAANALHVSGAWSLGAVIMGVVGVTLY